MGTSASEAFPLGHVRAYPHLRGMRFFLVLASMLLVGTLARAQYRVDLSKEEPLAVPDGLHLDSVITSFNDTASIGTVLRGIGNRAVPAFLSVGVSTSLEGMLHNGPASAGDLHCTMRVNELDISEVSGNSSEKCFCGLNFELLSKTDSGWARIFDHAAVSEFRGGSDATGKQPLNIRAALAQGLAEYDSAQKAGALSWTPLGHVPRAGVSDVDERAYAVLTSGVPARGLYRTFKDFRDQHPDTSLLFTLKPISTSDPLLAMVKLKVERGGTIPEYLWGLSDGKHAYINGTGHRFLRLDREGNRFIAHYRPPETADAGAVAAGIAFGMIGAAVYMAADHHSNPAKVEVDMLTGRIKPLEVPKASGSTAIAMSDHLFIYDRHCATDTTVDLFVYGGLEASLHQDSYHWLRLVPRLDAVPIEVKVGDGVPTGIEISTGRTDVAQVYLIKVDRSGIASIDHVNAQMAEALIAKLDPAKEVK
jgi:hypothetical protein